MLLQQCLPFTVLKRLRRETSFFRIRNVATVLTVYGIETGDNNNQDASVYDVATVLTVYGIETQYKYRLFYWEPELQQCLPFTVLKRLRRETSFFRIRNVATVLTVYGIETSLPIIAVACLI